MGVPQLHSTRVDGPGHHRPSRVACKVSTREEETMADDNLAARVAKLEAELAETKKALDAVKPKEPDRPRLNMPPVDWTASMRMPPDAAKKMALNVKAGKQTADEVRSSWARNS